MLRNHFKNVLHLLVLLWVLPVHAGAYEDFFSAVRRDDGGAVLALLQRGFDPNTVDPEGRPGLVIALQEQSFKAAEALMRHPQLDVNRLNQVAESALMMAALRGELEWCQRLVERGAHVNKTGWTPLHYAATSGHVGIIQLLLDRHAFIDARSPNGTTPLMMAARYGSEEATRLLMQAGADPTLRNERELSAADFARSVGRDALAQALERYASDYAARYGTGKR